MADALLMKAEEVASELRIGRSYAYQLMANGELPTIKIGRCVRVPRAGLESWVKRQIEGNNEKD